MSRTYFISDLHLDADHPEIFSLLETFLDEQRGADALYILGDLFETWIGDDDDAPLAGATRDLLRRFSSAGPELYFLRGNRDFLLGEQFARDCGGTLLPDEIVIDLYGKPALLMHGDTLCTDDRDYKVFRATVRDPAWQAETLSLPLEKRRELARALRAESFDTTRNKPPKIMDATPGAVEEVMARHGVSRLVHGHTHRPARHETAAGERWVLGDWGDSAWVLVAYRHRMDLDNYL